MSIGSLTFWSSDRIPAPVAPYSHVTTAGGWAFVTGQMPIDPSTGQILRSSGVAEQTKQVMANLCAVLDEAGYRLDQVVMVRAFLVDMEDYDVFNQAYEGWFAGQRLPSRTCVAVTGLALGARVEIDMTAYSGDPE
ncbi:MAG: RidA family protein [Actinomycetota bacterium]|nr:RidA family protein [Actinomycetota bacterium]